MIQILQYYSKANVIKTEILHSIFGNNAYELLDTLRLTDKTVKDIFEGLVAYCAPQKILIIKRLKFFQHEQLSGETFDNFFY